MSSLAPKTYVMALTAQEIEQRLLSIDSLLPNTVIRQSLSNPATDTVPSTQAVVDALAPIQTSINGLGDLADNDSVSLDSVETSGVLPIAKGGTGGLSLGDAQSNLGILTQTEIQQLINTSIPTIQQVWLDSTQVNGILPLSKGGTGSSSPAQALKNLGIHDSNGKVPVSQLPAVAITDTFPVSSQAAMLALSAEKGDVAIRTDLNKSFILMQEPASSLSNWKELLNDAEVKLTPQIRESLRRSYAEAGYTLVEGSFETGATLSSTADVLLLVSAGTTYAWAGTYPSGGHIVAAGTDPAVVPGYVLRSLESLRGTLLKQSILSMLCGGSLYESINKAKLCNEIVYLSAGNYSGQPIDASGTAGVIGNGINASVIHAPVSFVNASDVYGYGASFVLNNLAVDVDTVQPALSIEFSHYYSGENIAVINQKAGGTALTMANAWLANFKNCYFQGDMYGALMKGSCHAVKFERCRFYSGANGDAFRVENTTSAADGNLSVALDTCDIEFCDGNGINNSGAQKLLVLNPYHESVSGFNLINTNNVSTTVDGGSIGVGKQQSVVKIDSGNVIIKNCRLYSESAASSLQKLVTSTGGAVGFFDIELALPVLGPLVVKGELIRGPSKQSLCRRSVNTWQPSNMLTEYVSQGVNKFTTSVTGPTFCEVYCFNDRDNYIFPSDQLFNVYITYSSNTDFNLRTQTSAGGGAPTSPYIPLPTTNGETVTMIVPIVSGFAFSNSVQTSIYRDDAVAGEYIVLHDIGIFSNKAHPIDRQIWFPS